MKIWANLFTLCSCLILASVGLAQPQYILDGPSGEKVFGLGKILAMDYAPTGDRFATASQFGLFIWDVESGDIVHHIEDVVPENVQLKFTPDGEELIVTTGTGEIEVWDAVEGTRIRSWQGHAGPITAVALSDDGQTLVTGGGKEDQLVHWWTYASGERFRTDDPKMFPEMQEESLGASVEFNDSNIRDLHLNDDASELLISTTNVARVRIGQATPVSVHRHASAVFTTPGRMMGFQPITQYRTEPFRLIQTLGSISSHGRPISVEPSPENQHFFIESNANSGAIDELIFERVGSEERGVLYIMAVRFGAFSSDGSTALVVDESQNVNLIAINGESATLLETYEGHSGHVNDVLFDPNAPENAPNQLLTTGGLNDNAFRIWNLDTGERNTLDTGHIEERGSNLVLGEIIVSPDTISDTLVMLGSSGRLFHTGNYWTATYVSEEILFSPFSSPLVMRTITGLPSDFANENRYSVAIGTAYGELAIYSNRFFDVDELVLNNSLHRHMISANTSTPDGNTIYSADVNGRISSWNWRENFLNDLHRVTAGVVESLALDTSNKYLAAASHHGTQIIDVEAGEVVQELLGHDGFVNDVAFSPDGTLLATASQDGTILLWNPETGDVVTRLNGHICEVNAIAFSPDGTQLTSVGNDGTARVWDLEEHTAVDDWLQHLEN